MQSTVLSHFVISSSNERRRSCVSTSLDLKELRREPCSNKSPRSSGYDTRLACQRSRVRIPLGPLETFASQLLGALYRMERKAETKKAPKCLTPEIGLRKFFRSLISSSKNQTNPLAAKKCWMKFFAPFIRPPVEPFRHNKHPMEHGSVFLIAYSMGIGQHRPV